MIAGRIISEIVRAAKQRDLADKPDKFNLGILTAAGVRVYAFITLEMGHGYVVLEDLEPSEDKGYVYMDLTQIIAVQPVWLP